MFGETHVRKIVPHKRFTYIFPGPWLTQGLHTIWKRRALVPMWVQLKSVHCRLWCPLYVNNNYCHFVFNVHAYIYIYIYIHIFIHGCTMLRPDECQVVLVPDAFVRSVAVHMFRLCWPLWNHQYPTWAKAKCCERIAMVCDSAWSLCICKYKRLLYS